ncbi:BCLAF1 and THRAP3 family member 3 isoform X2 [Hoplias malabaricus]|uniref:BCLAF1 and THRAP3 family member 3 isoform X2 n=1 Tax=Hoplias malabaricus TaxID=27720 RepID=UPI0034631AB7
MSRPRSESPLYPRNSQLPGRREDVFYGDQYRSSADPWRNPKNVNNLEGNSHWNNNPSQGEVEVDHWAKFIEAIGHAGRRRPLPMSKYQTQEDVTRFETKQSHSPRLPRERLSSPEAVNYGDEPHKFPSPGQRRIEHDGAHLVHHYSNRNHWDSRGSSPRHSQGKRHDRMEQGYHNEEREDRYHERSSFTERSSQSYYREHHPHPKRIRGLDPQEDYSVSNRGFSPSNAPVIVEHDHGIPNRDSRSRDPPRRDGPFRDREHPRNRDPPRGNDVPRGRDPPRTAQPLRNREQFNHRRDHDHHTVIQHGRHGGPAFYVGDESRLHPTSLERRSPIRGRSQPQESSRVEPHARERHRQRTMHLNSDVDLRNNKNNRANRAWVEEMQPRGNHDGGLAAHVSKGIPHRGNVNTKAVIQKDFSEHETLRIKVDMSRPVGHSSHLGYSSERQLSLDLVNVGRQRLDFLPMLEHSGTYRESAMHSGTFAQEIITLVHHVKEQYFQSKGITLNERFSSEQHYSLEDNDDFAEEPEELENMDRPLDDSTSDTQIFCKIGSWQVHQSTAQRRQVPAPGDLRHDLERRRQQRLEGVKITIAGGSFSHVASQNMLFP